MRVPTVNPKVCARRTQLRFEGRGLEIRLRLTNDQRSLAVVHGLLIGRLELNGTIYLHRRQAVCILPLLYLIEKVPADPAGLRFLRQVLP